jgi:hypothetical protein
MEELRSRGLRKFFSFRLFCGAVGLALALAIHFPFIRAASLHREVPFYGIPTSKTLQMAYVEMLILSEYDLLVPWQPPPFILALVLLILLFAWASSGTAKFIDGQSSAERLGWFFLVVPIAGYILAKLVTHAFWPRYFIPFLAGMGVAIGCFLYRNHRDYPKASILILVVAVPLFLNASANRLRFARTPVTSHRADVSDFVDDMLPVFRQEGKLFVLTPTLRSFVEARYYASDPQMIRVLLPPNYPLWFPTQNPIDIRYFSKDELRRHARETVLIDPEPELLSDLEKLGFQIHWRITEPQTIVYLK